MIELLSADPDLTNKFKGTILPDDPGGVNAQASPQVSISLSEDDFYAESLGGRGQGTHTVTTTYQIDVYVANPADANSAENLLALKTQLVELTDTLRECLWKYRTDPAEAGMPEGARLWYNAKFRAPATKYLNSRNFRKSSTQIDFLSWTRNR